MNTVIFCAGYYGRKLLKMLKKGLFSKEWGTFENVFFCDRNLYLEEYIDGCCVISPSDLCNINDGFRILISSPSYADEVIGQLMSLEIKAPVYLVPKYVYNFAWNDSNMPPFVKLDIDKPRIRLIQIPITETCNLNCKGCNLLFNSNSNNMMSIQQFNNHMENLHRLFSGVKHLTLLGGEPMLHPYLGELIVIARNSFPDAEIEIRTNGTLISRLNNELLKIISDTYTEVVVSLYPPMMKKKEDISILLRKNNIRFSFMGPFFEFRKIINLKGDYDPEKIYQKCDKCINLFDGSISCGLGHIIEGLESKYNVRICKDEIKRLNRFDISNTELNGWEIIRHLDSPSELCSFCAYQNWGEDDEHISFSWASEKDASLEDWILC